MARHTATVAAAAKAGMLPVLDSSRAESGRLAAFPTSAPAEIGLKRAASFEHALCHHAGRLPGARRRDGGGARGP